MQHEKIYRRMMERMLLIRHFEEKLQLLFEQKRLHGTTHLCVGEEAACVGMGFALEKTDYLFATHRNHGQIIGKGADIRRMMAEMFGKQTGYCRGRGGSMHMTDPEIGVIASNGIVGANAPIACGAALTAQYQGDARVSAIYLGDGAANEGAVHEAMNLAAAWKLPVLFLLVDNRYGLSTPLENAVNDTDLTKRAYPFDMNCFEVDGNDVCAVYEVTCAARAYALENGPALIVAHSYRISGHSRGDRNLYRTDEEVEYWKTRCPIKRFGDWLTENGIYDRQAIDDMDADARNAVEEAVAFALASPDAYGAVEDGAYA